MSTQAGYDLEEIAWELLSFLALAPDEQAPLVAQVEEFFCKEDKHENPGANYLLGVAYSVSACKNALFDGAHLGEESALFELDVLLQMMLRDQYGHYWSKADLRENVAWRLVRRLARLVLDEAGLPINVPGKQFLFTEILEIEGYPWRGLPRVDKD